MLNPRIDLLIDPVESAAERARWLREARKYSAESGPKDMVVGPGEEQSNAKTEAGRTISMSVWDAFDESVQPQATQMISHFPRRELLRTEAEKGSQTEAKLTVGETGGQ